MLTPQVYQSTLKLKRIKKKVYVKLIILNTRSVDDVTDTVIRIHQEFRFQ